MEWFVKGVPLGGALLLPVAWHKPDFIAGGIVVVLKAAGVDAGRVEQRWL